MRRLSVWRCGAALPVFLALLTPLACWAEGDPSRRHGQLDTSVEDAIMQTQDIPEPQQHRQLDSGQAHQHLDPASRQEQAARRRQQAQDDLLKQHEEAHAELLKTQRQQADAQGEAVARRREEKLQQESLGRGSLRNRRQPAEKQPAVSRSRPGDVFAEQMEQKLAAARQRMTARREEQEALLVQLEAAGAQVHGQRAKRAPGQNRQHKPKPRAQAQGRRQQQQQQAGGSIGGGSIGGTGKRSGSQGRIPLPLIIFMTIAMAAAAGLGALPFFFVRSMSEGTTGLATAVACGVMLAASFDLIHDGQPYGGALTVGGVLLGGSFIRWVQQQLAAYEDIQFGSLQGSSARKTVLMVGIMAAHALGEGCAVGVSFCGERGWTQGLLTTLAIGVHNIPEGLAKATVLVGQGVSPRRALGWSVLTCLPQPLVAIPSFVFVEAFTMVLPVALGFAAGCMVWMVFAELLPDALEHTPAAQVATAATVSAAGLEGFRMLFASMEQAEGGFGPVGSAPAAALVMVRMAPPLLVLLPAIVTAAVGGGVLGGSAVPAPVAWGVAAAVALSAGGGAVADQLLWRPQVPALHTAAAGAAGAALAVLLHRQLLSWAGSSSAAAARKLLAKGKGAEDALVGNSHGSNSGAAVGPADVEALEYASMYQQHHLHHQVHAAHPLFRSNGQAQPPHPHDPAALADSQHNGGIINGFGGSSSSLHYQAPYHRGGGSLPGADSGVFASVTATPNGGPMPPLRGLRHAGLLPPIQLSAGAAALMALVGGSITTGWHLACSLLLLGEDRSAAILPAAALFMAGPGLGAGALARTLPGRSGLAVGAWLGGGVAAVAAVAASMTAARAHESAHTATLVKSMLYPFGITNTAQAVAGGALCAAAVFCYGAGAAVKAPSTRGGLLLGLAATGVLAVLRYALCCFTPYCLSVQLLLQAR